MQTLVERIEQVRHLLRRDSKNPILLELQQYLKQKEKQDGQVTQGKSDKAGKRW